MAAIAPLTLGLVAGLPVFDIRNGHGVGVTPLFVRGTLEASYHWVPVAKMATNAAVANMGAYIRSHYAQIKEHSPTMDEASARLRALIIGCSRAVLTSFYTLAVADITAQEIDAPIYEVDNSGAVVVARGASASLVTLAQGMADLTPAEQEQLRVVATCAVASLPLQGYSLVKTGHHYLSDPKGMSFRAFTAVEKQFMGSANIKAWFEASKDLIRDAMWHKSGHPVDVTLKEAIARSYETPDILRAAHIGSAAVRLPVKDSAVERAETYSMLARTVDPMITSYGCVLDVSTLDLLLEYEKACKADGKPPNQFAFPSTYSPQPPLTGRADAVALIEAVCTKNAGIFAWLFGYFNALMNNTDNASSVTPENDTLRQSYALKALKNSMLGNFLEGMEDYKDYKAFKSSQRASGILVTKTFILSV